MECPKCKSNTLKQKGYDSPLYCNQCGGMWLESEKLPTFIEESHDIQNNETSASENDMRTGFCPSGHGIMTRTRVETEEPFYLEKCSKCGGIWFDKGEWEKIITNNFAQNLSEMWCKSWQAKQRKETSRNTYLESNKELLGVEIFNEVMALSEKLKSHPEKGRAIALLQQEII